MGFQLTQYVMQRCGGLSGNAYKVLMTMAHTALDDDARPMYYGGWEACARALGYTAEEVADGSGKRAVMAAFKELDDALLIRRLVDKAHAGTRQFYELTLDPKMPEVPRAGRRMPRQKGADIAPNVASGNQGRVSSQHPLGCEASTQVGAEIGQEGCGRSTPRTNDDQHHDQMDDPSHPFVTKTGAQAHLHRAAS